MKKVSRPSIGDLVQELRAELDPDPSIKNTKDKFGYRKMGELIGFPENTIATWASGKRRPQLGNILTLASFASPKLRAQFLTYADFGDREDGWERLRKA